MPLSETSNPTTTDILAQEPSVNGDVGAAQDEIIRRLGQLLPDAIDATNTARGWTIPATAIPAVNEITLAPDVLTDDYIGDVLVSVSVTTSSNGIGAFKNVVQVSIYSIDARIQSGQMLTVNWRRAELIRACLLPFLNGCVNADGVRVWRVLQPQGYSMISGAWAQQYSGTICRFALVQAPNEG